jgi:hypothetical protein
VHRIECREFNSADIFCLSLLDFDTEAFNLILFSTMHKNSVMTYVEKLKVSMLKNNVELVLDKIDTFCFLLLAAEIHGSPHKVSVSTEA